jgi:hypothetical protein
LRLRLQLCASPPKTVSHVWLHFSQSLYQEKIMSHKHYRTPARTLADQTREQSQPARDPLDVRCLTSVKVFLERILKRAVEAIDEADALPKGEEQSLPAQHAWFERRSNQIAIIARVGIAACKAMLQALRLTNSDTEEIRKLVDETVVQLTARAHQQTPAFVTS